LKHFSQPAKDRPVYRLIDSGHISTISEFGLECGVRMRRMIELATRHHPPGQIRYAGFDLFEARAAGTRGLTLKEVHCELSRSGIQTRLVPGTIVDGIGRAANTLPHTDLMVISGGIDHATLERAWLYFPRMLHAESVVLLEVGNIRPEFQKLNYAQVCELARRSATALRRAA
jgi:hypothetical protein